MLNKKLNPKLLWMQFEDVLAPRLGLTVWDRVVYSYLLRHSLVVGKLRLHFAVMSVARDLGLSNGPVRQAVRRLDELGALRLLERSKTGHLVEMRLPEQIRAVRPGKNGAPRDAEEPPASALEATDFLKTWALRKTIHDRERGACFYCLRRTPAHVQCLDHVVPTFRMLSQMRYQSSLLAMSIEASVEAGITNLPPPGQWSAASSEAFPLRCRGSGEWPATAGRPVASTGSARLKSRPDTGGRKAAASRRTPKWARNRQGRKREEKARV